MNEENTGVGEQRRLALLNSFETPVPGCQATEQPRVGGRGEGGRARRARVGGRGWAGEAGEGGRARVGG